MSEAREEDAMEEEPHDEKKKKSFRELGHESLGDFIQTVYKDIVQTTICSNAMPAMTEDHSYWESFDSFSNVCAKQGIRLLANIGNILQHSAVQCKWGENHLAGKSTADIEEQFEKLVDANDILLENVGALLDEAAGIKKKGEEPIVMTSTLKNDSAVVSSWNKRKEFLNKSAPYKLLMAKNIHRPQLNWMDTVDNRNIPFVPYLKYKPNAMKPMGYKDKRNVQNTGVEMTQDEMPSAKHPYHYELSQFEPNDWQLELHTPRMYLPLEETPLTMVDTQESLDEMMGKLRQVKEIVIDLEHHNYRSFQGIVCLVQISTRKEDFIVDSLKLRHELCVLNEVFTDPRILKVLHGSDADIGWLQRDFGVYLINMFDTGQAARTLQEARFSLAHLLQKYCTVTAQKQYQLADWRIRPLPAEMIRYAREDTHYLLYVCDILRNELITRGNEMQNLLRLVYTKSTDLCASLYKKPLCTSDSHLTTYYKYRKRFNLQQLECFRVLYQWRDKIGRQEDESTGYVLPNHMMFQVAENLPRDQEGIIACCNPVPPLVNQHVADIVRLVTDARFYDPDDDETIVPSTSVNKPVRKEKEEDRYLTETTDSRSGFEIYPISGPKVRTKEPTLTLFEVMLKEHVELSAGKKKAKEFMEMLKSPFEMYLPNTGKPSVAPKEINETWQNLSKGKMAEKESLPPSESESTPKTVTPAEEFLPISDGNNERGSNVGKKKRRRHGLDDDGRPLREMLPKKEKIPKQTSFIEKIPKPLSEHLDDLLEESGSLDIPVRLNYNKNTKASSDFVPFEYSKADFKKFDAARNKGTDDTANFDQTEEPNFKGPVKTHLKSGPRQMSF